jgi:hypothetical protein
LSAIAHRLAASDQTLRGSEDAPFIRSALSAGEFKNVGYHSNRCVRFDISSKTLIILQQRLAVQGLFFGGTMQAVPDVAQPLASSFLVIYICVAHVWLAYRDDYPLLRDGKPARFATVADAQRAADVHELDKFPSAKVIDDGYSWLPDPEIEERSLPHRVKEREKRQVGASGFLP